MNNAMEMNGTVSDFWGKSPLDGRWAWDSYWSCKEFSWTKFREGSSESQLQWRKQGVRYSYAFDFIFTEGLSWNTTDDMLREAFAQCGIIEHCKVDFRSHMMNRCSPIVKQATVVGWELWSSPQSRKWRMRLQTWMARYSCSLLFTVDYWWTGNRCAGISAWTIYDYSCGGSTVIWSGRTDSAAE